MKEDCIIKIDHLSKSFSGTKVLDDISLEIKQGEFVTFLGPSGCGKTTLLRLIAGFHTADEGKIFMDGEDISGVPPYKRQLNTVFQRYALFPHLDVYENVAFSLKLNKVPEAEINKRVKKVLKMVSMTDYEERDVDTLSGGQQQRIAIARALINQPRVLLLDEPLAALDLKMRQDMQIELKEMHKKLGITFIYVTHDQEEALTLSDTIVVLKEGRIQQVGTPMDIYNEPQNVYVADFIGQSNILDGKMISDRKVSFIAHEFDCVDEGFGENIPVDVVIRPEDIYIMNNTEAAQFTGVVKSCTFKGVHYEMFVDTAEGYEMMIQDYNPFEVGSTVGMLIKPQDIQVMHKPDNLNVFDGKMVDATHVCFLDKVFECRDNGLSSGDAVEVRIEPRKVDLLDYIDDATLVGNVDFLFYKGDHYALEVRLDNGLKVCVSTQDVWDKNDLIGINFRPDDLRISKLSKEND